jgi:hypothetical protein
MIKKSDREKAILALFSQGYNCVQAILAFMVKNAD